MLIHQWILGYPYIFKRSTDPGVPYFKQTTALIIYIQSQIISAFPAVYIIVIVHPGIGNN